MYVIAVSYIGVGQGKLLICDVEGLPNQINNVGTLNSFAVSTYFFRLQCIQLHKYKLSTAKPLIYLPNQSAMRLTHYKTLSLYQLVPQRSRNSVFCPLIAFS